jgi:hypothetical protein
MMPHTLKSLLLAFGILLAALCCTDPAAGKANQNKGAIVSLDGLQSRTPSDWVEEEPSSRFRIKQFRLSAIGDDKDNAELVIFAFPSGGGGSVSDNIKRWKSQFVPPEGKKIDDVAKVDEFKVSGVPVTYLDIQGTYLFRERPADPNSATTRRPNYRMLAVVFQGKKGPCFIRLVGPADTVAQYKKGFDEWLKAFK